MVYPKLTPVLHGFFLPAIFREHQVHRAGRAIPGLFVDVLCQDLW